MFLLSLLICAIVAMYLFRPHQPGLSPPSPVIKKDGQAPQIMLTNIEQTHIRQGQKKWSLMADTARLSANGNTSVLKNIILTAFQSSGAPVQITADQGVFNRKNGEIRISGNVIIEDPVYKIQTQSLHYQDEDGIIYTNDRVTIDGNSLHLKGDSMQYDITAMKAVLTGNIQGFLQSTPVQP